MPVVEKPMGKVPVTVAPKERSSDVLPEGWTRGWHAFLSGQGPPDVLSVGWAYVWAQRREEGLPLGWPDSSLERWTSGSLEVRPERVAPWTRGRWTPRESGR